MAMPRKELMIVGIALLLAGVTSVQAGASSEEIARLGADLTPLGAEKAGNADGTIPAWEGGITSPPDGYDPKKQYVDPFAGDSILFTITKENMDLFDPIAFNLKKTAQSTLND